MPRSPDRELEAQADRIPLSSGRPGNGGSQAEINITPSSRTQGAFTLLEAACSAYPLRHCLGHCIYYCDDLHWPGDAGCPGTENCGLSDKTS
jgi:hypothetical protein